MGLKPKISFGLMRCGNCGQRYANPLNHVCRARAKPAGRTRFRPRVSASFTVCGRCGKRYNNPLAHTCTERTDFRARKAAHERAQREAARKRDRHAPEDCRDGKCPRYPCVTYRNGFAAGYRKGFDQGDAEGYARGYAEGWEKGFAARPLRTVYIEVPAGR